MKAFLLLVLKGTKWYRTTKGGYYGAWGFAAGGSSIMLRDVDVLTLDGEKRISWYLNRPEILGGYRCGTTINVNADPSWERVFYHAN